MRLERRRRRSALLASLVLALAVLVACGSDAEDEGGSPEPTASGATAVTGPSTADGTASAGGDAVPAGWKPFRATSYSGAIPQRWEFIELSTENLAHEETTRRLRDAGADQLLVEQVRQALAMLPPGSRFGIFFLRNDTQFRTNINITPCNNRQWTAEAWQTANQSDAAQSGTKLVPAETASIQGRQYEVYRLDPTPVPGVVAHNTLPVSPGGCGYAVTLSERQGASSALPEFIRFLGTLRFEGS